MPTQTASTATRARHPLRLSNVTLDAPRRLQGDNRDRDGLDVNTSGSTSSGTVAQHTSARTAGSGLPRAQQAAAALFRGGCGGTTGDSNLVGNLAGSSGLLGATAAEEAETEEEIKSGASRLHHQDATSNISKNGMDDSLGGGGGNNGDGDQQQQMSQQMRWASSGGTAVSLGNSSVSLDVGRPGAQTVAADQAEAPAAVLARAAE